MAEHRKLTQAELVAEARARFGDDPLDWAFQCPRCGDVATGRDFREALAEHPRTNRDESATTASDLIGQECIGRTLGALSGPATGDGKGQAKRGCDWCAYGFFPGPWEIELPDGRTMNGFPLAETEPAVAEPLRPAVRDLVKALKSCSTFGRPCWMKRTPAWAALIVPSLTDGADGPYELLRTFRRSTLDEAVAAGLVVLHGDLVPAPPIGGRRWAAQPEVRGRVIALADEQDGGRS